MTVESSSPVAHVKLDTNDQWIVIVGHAFSGGLFAVGPFPTAKAANEWDEDKGGDSSIICCLKPETTILDRCGYPLHEKDSFRS